MISVKLLFNFIEITIWHVCSPVNLLCTPFNNNTSRGLFLCFHLDPRILILADHPVSDVTPNTYIFQVQYVFEKCYSPTTRTKDSFLFRILVKPSLYACHESQFSSTESRKYPIYLAGTGSSSLFQNVPQNSAVQSNTTLALPGS